MFIIVIIFFSTSADVNNFVVAIAIAVAVAVISIVVHFFSLPTGGQPGYTVQVFNGIIIATIIFKIG